MKERPILFKAPMVRALLDGSKTQTRRVAPIRELNILSHPGDMVTWGVSFLKAVKGVLSSHSGGKFSDLQARSIIASMFNPYGKPGDRLWVRETWQHLDNVGQRAHEFLPHQKHSRHCFFLADESDPTTKPLSGRWRPSIHMPRWASRITLEITGVRVERLQDISEADARAEGCVLLGQGPSVTTSDLLWSGREWPLASAWYRELWEQINGTGSWNANPWVWVVEFRRVKP
jgi:hypothetical protein